MRESRSPKRDNAHLKYRVQVSRKMSLPSRFRRFTSRFARPFLVACVFSCRMFSADHRLITEITARGASQYRADSRRRKPAIKRRGNERVDITAK